MGSKINFLYLIGRYLLNICDNLEQILKKNKLKLFLYDKVSPRSIFENLFKLKVYIIL
jgi:hypothetical protein